MTPLLFGLIATALVIAAAAAFLYGMFERIAWLFWAGLGLLVALGVGIPSFATEMDKKEAKKAEDTLRRELPGMTQQAKTWCEEHRIYPITLERARPARPGAPWDFQVTYTDLEGVVRGVRVTCPPGDRCYLAQGEGK